MAKKKNKETNAYIVYTDGGCARNPGGPGGAASIIISPDGNETEVVSGYYSTTNNRMELTAVLQALECLPVGVPIKLYSDSQYVLNCISGNWKRQKNTDLWKSYAGLAKGHKIRTYWVKGHNGNKYNERCDTMCTIAMQSPDKEDSGYRRQKENGAAFYREVDRYSISSQGGAMSVKIRIPEDFEDRKYHYTSARDYAERWHVHNQCAKAIMEFSVLEPPKFASYLSLKTGGIDFWSRKTADTILASDPQKDAICNIINDNLSEEKDRKTAVRWYARGLRLEDAIRKVLVDKEISENAIRRRK